MAHSDSARMTAVVFQTAKNYHGKRMMGRRLHSHYLTLLLLAVVTLGYGQQVWACPMMLSPTPPPALFLRAERLPDGRRTFKLLETDRLTRRATDLMSTLRFS